MFEQESALAQRACKMVAFLDRETPDFMSPCCSVLIIDKKQKHVFYTNAKKHHKNIIKKTLNCRCFKSLPFTLGFFMLCNRDYSTCSIMN